MDTRSNSQSTPYQNFINQLYDILVSYYFDRLIPLKDFLYSHADVYPDEIIRDWPLEKVDENTIRLSFCAEQKSALPAMQAFYNKKYPGLIKKIDHHLHTKYDLDVNVLQKIIPEFNQYLRNQAHKKGMRYFYDLREQSLINLMNECGDEKSTEQEIVRSIEMQESFSFKRETTPSVYFRAQSGSTLLHAMAAKGYNNCIQKLLNNDADINVRDNWGLFPLYKAAENGKLDTVNFLIGNHADINSTTKYYRETALIAAVKAGHSDVAQSLLAVKADINHQNIKHENALMIAAELLNAPMIKLLIKAGADISLKNIEDHTAIDICMQKMPVESGYDSDEDDIPSKDPLLLNKWYECLRILFEAGVKLTKAPNICIDQLKAASESNENAKACLACIPQNSSKKQRVVQFFESKIEENNKLAVSKTALTIK